MLDFIYQSPVKMFFGESKLDEVVSEIRQFGTKVMLVFGGSSFMKNGYYQTFTDALTKEGIIYIDFGGNIYPSLAKVREGVKICRDEQVDCVIGIGGGTCMDVAKAIAFGVKQDEDIWEFLTFEVPEEGRPHLPVGTIVTYPSSGSEMNGAAQIDDDETRMHTGLSFVYPNFAWLNPEYMTSIESVPLAYGQLTSFAQISGAYLSSGSCEPTDIIILDFLKMILKYLKQSVENPKDKEARTNLMLVDAMVATGVGFFGKEGGGLEFNAFNRNHAKLLRYPLYQSHHHCVPLLA